MSIDFPLHVLFFVLLSVAVAAVVSGYREEEPRAILRGTWRRLGKICLFSLVLAAGMFLVEWVFFGRPF